MKQSLNASLIIAEASQRDNEDMKATAEQSKTISLATLRDSESMRTMTTVTVVTLPATACAVS
jgi:hypothetical protein